MDPIKKENLYVNVASSIEVVNGFINLDNHLFIRMLRFPKFFEFILPKKYQKFFNAFVNASKKASLVKHDCRKPLKFNNNSVDHILCSHFLEHVYPIEADVILGDFNRVLKKGGTLHIIVPDLRIMIDQYLVSSTMGDPKACDKLVEATLLTRRHRGTFLFRVLEFFGGYGLQHLWMYDAKSIKDKILANNFIVDDQIIVPSKSYREGDASIHIFAVNKS
jgi:predicted SAM-dependent methyltransferase